MDALPNRFPAIDGLRAVAVLGVILFHLHARGMVLGGFGVELFFVISGFLITGILLDSKPRPSYFKNFYARRVLRIFPIYYAVLLVLLSVAIWKHWPFGDVGYYVFYLQNHPLGAKDFQPAFPVGYNQTWTLAVEEQFYFLWPLIVYFMSRKQLEWLSVALILVAPAARIVFLMLYRDPFLTFTPLVCNIDSLAIGALLAIWIRRPQSRDARARRICEALSVVSLVAVLAIFFSFGHCAYWDPRLWISRVNINVIFLTVLSVWFATVLFHAVVWESWIKSALSLRLLTHIGKISYGIYIFHYPVMIYGLRLFHLPQTRPIAFVVNLLGPYVLALLSWKFFETRFLRMKRNFV